MLEVFRTSVDGNRRLHHYIFAVRKGCSGRTYTGPEKLGNGYWRHSSSSHTSYEVLEWNNLDADVPSLKSARNEFFTPELEDFMMKFSVLG